MGGGDFFFLSFLSFSPLSPHPSLQPSITSTIPFTSVISLSRIHPLFHIFLRNSYSLLCPLIHTLHWLHSHPSRLQTLHFFTFVLVGTCLVNNSPWDSTRPHSISSQHRNTTNIALSGCSGCHWGQPVLLLLYCQHLPLSILHSLRPSPFTRPLSFAANRLYPIAAYLSLIDVGDFDLTLPQAHLTLSFSHIPPPSLLAAFFLSFF